MKRLTAMLCLLLVTSPVGFSLASEVSDINNAENSLEKAVMQEEYGKINNITINELVDEGIKHIQADNTINYIEKEEKIAELKEIAAMHGDEMAFEASSSSTTRGIPGISYVKPGPGRIRIFVSPTAVKVILVGSLIAYAASILATCGVSTAFAAYVSYVLASALENTSAVRYGFTMHGWDNYRHWNFRVGNTLAG